MMEFCGKPQDYFNRVKTADENPICAWRFALRACVESQFRFMGFSERPVRLGRF